MAAIGKFYGKTRPAFYECRSLQGIEQRGGYMRVLWLMVSLAFGGWAGFAGADEAYPAKPVTIVTPFAAGGGSDVASADARRVAAQNAQAVDRGPERRRSGGRRTFLAAGRQSRAGRLHAAAASRRDGDRSALYKDLQFDPLKSFEQIGLFTDQPMVIVGRKSMPAADVKALVEYLKKNEGKTNFASSGQGSATHLCAMLFEQATGTKVTMIQYKGSSPALIDLQADRVDLLCDAPSFVGQHVAAGTLKPYVVTGDKHLASMPGTPSATEAGIGQLNVSVWYGLYAQQEHPAPSSTSCRKRCRRPCRMRQSSRRCRRWKRCCSTSSKRRQRRIAKSSQSQIELWRRLIEKAGIVPN